jgi:hypothetical protein
VKTRYANFGVGWQHWFSPQVEIRRKWHIIIPLTPTLQRQCRCVPSIRVSAIAPDKNFAWIASVDLTWHF